jgi:two-component sensor histidine kinase
MNHRVANSLQLIASLIGLQAYSLEDSAVRDQLIVTRERVHAIMHVHRRLYTSSDVEIIQLDQYLAALSEDLGAAVRDRSALLRLTLDADPVTVPTDKAVSVGVIVNELITNACKYAYAPECGGEIRIRLKPAAEAPAVVLAVEDDGVGYADDHPPLGSGLGRQVVQAMAKSLSATVIRNPSFQGTRIEVRFIP